MSRIVVCGVSTIMLFAATLEAAERKQRVSAFGAGRATRTARPAAKLASDEYSTSSADTRASVNVNLPFRERILRKHDLNGNGRLDGKEKTAAMADIRAYRSEQRKVVIAMQKQRAYRDRVYQALSSAAQSPKPVSMIVIPREASEDPCCKQGKPTLLRGPINFSSGGSSSKRSKNSRSVMITSGHTDLCPPDVYRKK